MPLCETSEADLGKTVHCGLVVKHGQPPPATAHWGFGHVRALTAYAVQHYTGGPLFDGKHLESDGTGVDHKSPGEVAGEWLQVQFTLSVSS